ncbi:MAG: glycosyltransferase family 2 protein [Bacteroidia bacterium]|uniref:glycosyltransferase family 2 protein n=1 Tax=Candidatus Pollutiaquabacter sp. TaxID=3416354 RepID=UPI001A395F4B|nr:glycosyltransferase family 2 protein [Bacteroidota bacterium]MBL7948084.1 glycosyltransferase family 2 protein [Bacteroidia bacterium]MBP7438347.1 glycosyltransferase family 2 protein [Bacteroidia bacterium]HPD54249.1 glycosyltransferase family 2 protein [Bacteroidia bacterium]HRI41025.1 glycosyltransferase family 2 protein [Bacteroidia bacterium]
MDKTPFVSIIIPCRNEGRFIGKVLENILSQDYPASHLEVLIADGRSEDDTRQQVEGFARRYPFIHLLDNPARVVPHALNACIRRSRGEVILRMDAHAIYPNDYVSRLVRALLENRVQNVGGVWVTEPGSDTPMAEAIALASAHRFGIGNADYRLGGGTPRLVDTVPFGCFPRPLFEEIGLFDEELVRNQDDEFNGRIIRSGGKILLLPDLKIRYFARERLSKIRRMFYQYGLFKPLVNRKLGKPATVRQLFPPLLVAGIMLPPAIAYWIPMIGLCWLGGLMAYLMMVVYFSLRLSNGNGYLLGALIRVFPTIHLSYGIGYWIGIIRFLIFRKNQHGKVHDPGISR